MLRSPCSAEGVFARRLDDGATREEGCRRSGNRPPGPRPGNRAQAARRPRAGLVTPRSGGPGTRSGGTMTPPRGARWTGTARMALGQRLRSESGVEPSLQSHARDRRGHQETRTREQKSPPWSAERRPHLRKKVRQDLRLVRHSALHPLGFFEGQEEGPRKRARSTAHPAPQIIRAMTLGCFLSLP
jgi:hypothetical protein